MKPVRAYQVSFARDNIYGGSYDTPLVTVASPAAAADLVRLLLDDVGVGQVLVKLVEVSERGSQ